MSTGFARKVKSLRLLQYRVFFPAMLTVAIAACNQPAPAPRAAALAQTSVERGKMLVIGGRCRD